jgi:hypothetical protein
MYLFYYTFKAFSIIFQITVIPLVFYVKRKLFRLDNIKAEMFSAINTIYNMNLNKHEYQYDVDLIPGFTMSNKDSSGMRFATSQISDKGLWFRINVDNIYTPIGFPVFLGIEQSLQSLSHIFDIDHLLYMGFQYGTLTTIKVELRMLRKDKGVYIERVDQPPSRIDIGINIKMKENLNIDYEAQLMRIDQTAIYRNSLPLNEFFQMIRLESIDNLDVIKQITELLPELKIPSAYDFTSDDFKQRLLLVKMFQY